MYATVNTVSAGPPHRVLNYFCTFPATWFSTDGTMIDWLRGLLAEGNFMPHGMCYLWQPGVLGLHVVSDALITLAYFSIPFTLVYFVRKRQDLQFHWMFLCFAVFIVACGTTHLMEIWVIWHPTYWLSGGIKAVTAVASVPTAILLVRLIPQALQLPSPATLRIANAELEREIADRRRAETEIRRINEQLEQRVAERTRELEATNRVLRQTQLAVMQTERLRALGQMASGIAHDINNALSPATLYSHSLLERGAGLSDELREDLRAIHGAIEDVAHTVARMRDFYRTREPQFAPVPVHLNRVLEQVIDLTRARWQDMPQERGLVINLETRVPADLPPVLGEEGEIRDALTNLVLNAVDAMPEGGKLTLHAYAESGQPVAPRSPSQVRVDVRDTGVGMTEEVRRRCMEPFFTTKGERGTGLGLAMVYGMAKRHGAHIEIESTPRIGTAMSLIFPATVAAHAAAVPHTVSTRSAHSLRILVVDDDERVLKATRRILESDGHRVTAAEGGQAGIDMFIAAVRHGEPFALVISDLGMPYVDGRKVAAAVKTASPRTPVLLVTGWGYGMRAESDRPAHVDRLLSKPTQVEDLRQALAELTTESASQRVAEL
jgi:signal transduction histidine kinase/ActR/RegA family two-component response regulator